MIQNNQEYKKFWLEWIKNSSINAWSDTAATLIPWVPAWGGKIAKFVAKNGDEIIWGTKKVENKINHIFWKKEHNLDFLIKKYWTQEKAYNKLFNLTKSQIWKKDWLFEKTINIWWENIIVRWTVIKWELKIWTAFKP